MMSVELIPKPSLSRAGGIKFKPDEPGPPSVIEARWLETEDGLKISPPEIGALRLFKKLVQRTNSGNLNAKLFRGKTAVIPHVVCRYPLGHRVARPSKPLHHPRRMHAAVPGGDDAPERS